jgi:hypothetical protein
MKPVKRARVGAYDDLLAEVADAIEKARSVAARSVNAVMTITYWHVGRRLVEQEQQGAMRAGYGEQLLKRLSLDLSKRFGRGFSERNLEQMRAFYLGWPNSQAASAKTLRSPTAERESHISQTVSAKLTGVPSWPVHSSFPLPWSHYARLLAVRNAQARAFYESEEHRAQLQSSATAAPASAPINIPKAIGVLALLGIASPVLELRDPAHGLIGLIILFVGIRFAWRFTAGRTVAVSGPHTPSPAGVI